MQRFMGLMPNSEIEIQKTFIDPFGLKITIEAGPNGWTIIYADHSTKYADVINPSEVNFQKAYDIVSAELGELIESKENIICEEG